MHQLRLEAFNTSNMYMLTYDQFLIRHFRVIQSVDGYTGKVVLTDRLLRHTTAGYNINVIVSDGWNTVGPSTIDVTITSKITVANQ